MERGKRESVREGEMVEEWKESVREREMVEEGKKRV